MSLLKWVHRVGPMAALSAVLFAPSASAQGRFIRHVESAVSGRPTGAHPWTGTGGFRRHPSERLRAKMGAAWAPDRLGLQEHQCQVHHGGATSIAVRWPCALEERDPQTERRRDSSHTPQPTNRTALFIWTGGAHPPEWAPHTWMGFSTGKWDGNVLTVCTTHIKQGWHRRNGIPSSDKIELTDHFILHGDSLTHVSVVTDPIYLSEPLIKSEDYVKNSNPNGNWLWPCEYVNELPGSDRAKVPHYLPGENPFLNEFRTKYKLPMDAVLGGPETMYPEYMEKIKAAK